MRHEVHADDNVAILVQLDVLDVQLDGTWLLNPSFQELCRVAYEADPSRFDAVIPEMILARAAARGYTLDVAAEDLAVTALEIATAEPA